MKKLINKTCLILILAVITVVPLLKMDNVSGATKEVEMLTLYNIINLQLIDYDGKPIEKLSGGKALLINSQGDSVANINLNTGEINLTSGGVSEMGISFKLPLSGFQKYVPADAKIVHPYGNSYYEVTTEAKTISVCYIPNQVDLILEPNKMAIYVDEGWKGKEGGLEYFIDSKVKLKKIF